MSEVLWYLLTGLLGVGLIIQSVRADKFKGHWQSERECVKNLFECFEKSKDKDKTNDQ